MKAKTLIVILMMLLCYSFVSAAYTSPGWTYGFELGASRGDNAGAAENFGPLGRVHAQLDIFKFMSVRAGFGYTQLHATSHSVDKYSTQTLMADYRVVLQPYRKAKFSPFVYAGVGACKDLKDNQADVIPLAPFGIGVQTKIRKGTLLEVSTGYSLTNSDMLNGKKRNTPYYDEMNTFTGKKQDGFYSFTVGLSFFNDEEEPTPEPIAPVVVVTPKPTPPPPPPVVVTPPPVIVKPPVVVTPPPVVVTPPPAVDLSKLDTDGDGLNDFDEINKYKTDPKKADTDGDGLNDYAEVMTHKTNPLNPDTDGEGLNDYAEVMTHKTNPLNPDTDGENLNDYVEVMQYKTNPLNPDTDGEGLNDYVEVMQYKTNPLNPDTDGDGLTDYEEVTQYKTDPLVKDTDKGSIDDGAEVKAGTNPLDPHDDVLNLTEGASFSLEGVLFETNKATILPASSVILEKAYTALAANPEVKIIIIGHTDNVGNDNSNQILSQKRADSVKAWLVAKGISADRMKTLGKGETQPRATNDTPAGRTLNRRIEFEIEK